MSAYKTVTSALYQNSTWRVHIHEINCTINKQAVHILTWNLGNSSGMTFRTEQRNKIWTPFVASRRLVCLVYIEFGCRWYRSGCIDCIFWLLILFSFLRLACEVFLLFTRLAINLHTNCDLKSKGLFTKNSSYKWVNPYVINCLQVFEPEKLTSVLATVATVTDPQPIGDNLHLSDQV